MNRSEKIRFEAIVDWIPNDAKRILDIGCARHGEEKRQSGNLHEFLHSKIDAQIVGIDVLEAEVKKMREEGYDVRVGDAEDIEFDSPFDVIVAGEVLEHLNNPGQFLQSATDALVNGGVVLLTTPNPDGFAYFRKALIGQSNNPTHTCWVDPMNLQTLVNNVAADIHVAKWEFLPPTGGVSMLLWHAGFERAAAPGYVATLRTE